MSSEVAWQEDHAKDFLALHEFLGAATSLDLHGTEHADWLSTVRAIRNYVQLGRLFIPNSDKLLALLDVLEKGLLAVAAVANLAKDANGQKTST